MIAYIIFIFVILILLSIDFIWNTEGYGVLMLIAVSLVVLFTILRFETGYDYLNYVGFLNLDIGELIDRKLELGFVVVVSLLKFFNIDYFWLFFLCGVSIVLFLFRGIKLYTENIRIAFLIFLLIPGLFLNSFSIMRQSLAIVFLFNAYYYLWYKCYRYWWCFFILALLFHYSVLFTLPFVWLAIRLEKKANVILLIGIPLSLFLAQINILNIALGLILGNSKFSVYLEYGDAGTNLFKLIVLNISVLPYLFFYKRFNELERSLLILVVFGLVLLNIFSNIGAITRISYYFKIFEIVLLSNVVSFFKKGWSRIIFCAILFVYFFSMFYSSLYFDYTEVNEYPKLTPYKTIFER